jgi:hypothetical protein
MISSRPFAGLLLLISITALVVPVFYVSAVPVLQIKISTDSTVYNVGSKVTVLANITLDNESAANLGAIEIDSPYGTPMVVRTIKTGNVSQMYFRVQILDFYTSDSSGTHKTLFNRGDTAYVNITIKNIDVVPRHVRVGVYAQGSDNRPFLAFYPSQDDIIANNTIQHLFSMPIPSSAATGQARIFASLFTDLPANMGYAYCPESAANFSIGSSTPILPQQPEYSNITFNLPRKDCKLGNYTVYAATNYQVLQTANDNANFAVILLGDVVKDNIINMRDISAVILVFNTTPSSPNWNPEADLNKDDVVNMRDISILVQTFQNSAVP